MHVEKGIDFSLPIVSCTDIDIMAYFMAASGMRHLESDFASFLISRKNLSHTCAIVEESQTASVATTGFAELRVFSKNVP